ncbi:hypothetical protein GCM10007858_27980 [Bradyrhizobium liaoningense]|nr:hypothetical protein GCM10007858_27980 [Bradyrhizobium liaoningense]
MRCAALVGAKPAKLALPDRRGVAGDQDRALAAIDHVGRQFACQVQQTHHVDLEIALQHLRVDLAKAPPTAADGVVDQHLGRAEAALDVGNHAAHLIFVGDVAGHRVHISRLLRQAIDQFG